MLIVRLATLYDIPALMLIVRKTIPLMHEAGNFQWDDDYPNAQVFLRDIELRQLWVADIHVSESADPTEPEAPGIIGGFAAITTDQSEEYAQVGWDLTEKAIVVHRLAV